jgi:mannopine transport system substrate-binding protein
MAKEMRSMTFQPSWAFAFRRPAGRASIGVAILCFIVAGGALAQEKRVVVATTGGVYEKALRETWFDPFTEQTGVKVVTVTATDSEQRARAQAMLQANAVTWDLMNNVDVIAASPQNRSFTVDLSSFCEQFAKRNDLLANTCHPSGVRIAYNLTLLAYNGDRFKSQKPSGWADFWNMAAFPGLRALPNFSDPWRVYAAALMADGVSPDKLFPLDVERALKKLDEIRPQVQLWWRTGDQSQQGFRNGDYVLGMIWGTRANALKAEGLNVQMSFDQAFMLADTLQLIRSSPNPEGALQLLKFYLENPSVEARFAERFGITPASRDAIALMSEETRSRLPTSPDAFKKIVTPGGDMEQLDSEVARRGRLAAL